MNDLTLVIPIGPMAKARPRVTRRNVYMPAHYQAWREKFAGYCLGAREVVGTFALTVAFRTKTGNMRPDLDNAVGAVLDALQDAKVIANDSACKSLVAFLEKGHRSEITITLTPLGGAGG
jgi:Holliday junction resolvase RusA-like endonuclease